MGLCYRTSRWLDRLWAEHLELSQPARDLVQQGIAKQGEPFAGFGSEALVAKYLPRLATGEWMGTMNLTEAGAGSDVGALTTTAHKNPDGTYTIKGDKIFITNGDQDLTENIIHPVLARVSATIASQALFAAAGRKLMLIA